MMPPVGGETECEEDNRRSFARGEPTVEVGGDPDASLSGGTRVEDPETVRSGD